MEDKKTYNPYKIMKHNSRFYAVFFCMVCSCAMGQVAKVPKLTFLPSDSVPSALARLTNFNPSLCLADTALTLVADSLRSDATATVFTVYETDSDSIVGLWQVGSGSNRALWLNSQRVSYDDFSITYRRSNELGVIVHSMQYQYPPLDSSYCGRDTLFLGREGNTFGNKNLCALFYFPGSLDHQFKRRFESALAIRFGALLHGPYLNSLSDTLWNPLADDSLFSAGVCGIGRDDSLSLLQPRSSIRNDILTLQAASPLSDRQHILLGRDTGALHLDTHPFFVDTVPYAALARRWKLRAHTAGSPSQGELSAGTGGDMDALSVRLSVALPLPADALRLMLATADGSTSILTPDSAMAFSLDIDHSQDLFLTLLINPSAIPLNTKGAKSITNDEEYTEIDDLSILNSQFSILNSQFSIPDSQFSILNSQFSIPDSQFSIPNSQLSIPNSQFSISPNPTSGRYTLRLSQPDDDIVDIRVVDAVGRVVEQHSSAEPLSHYTYDGHLPADGVYYVTVSSNGRRQTIKLVVVK